MDGGGAKSMSGMGGGLGPGLGGGFGEDSMEDNAFPSNSTQSASNTKASNAIGNLSPAQQAKMAKAGANVPKPREVGTLGEELIKRPLQDIAAGLKSFFDINALLGIKPAKDTPEEQAKKKQIHQRYNQLTQEEQAYAQQKYQKEMQKKQQEEQERQIKKQQEEQAKAQEAIAPPAGPQRGEVGPAGKSRKSKAMQQLKNDRTTINKVQGAN